MLAEDKLTAFWLFRVLLCKRVKCFFIININHCFVNGTRYTIVFSHSCLPALPQKFKEAPSGTRLKQAATGFNEPATTQDAFTASHSGLGRKPDCALTVKRKRMVTLLPYTKRTLTGANRLKLGPNREGTRDICGVSHHRSRRSPGCSSPERKIRRDPFLIPEEARTGVSEPEIILGKEWTWGRFEWPHGLSSSSLDRLLPERDYMRLRPLNCTETTKASLPQKRSCRKRTWEAFRSSHGVPGELPDCSSPTRKRMKMSLLYFARAATIRAGQAQKRPRRKRTWDTFGLSHHILRRVRDRSSPARKKMKMSLAYLTKEAGTGERDSKIRPFRKRTWHTFMASHPESNESPNCTSPQRKKMKTCLFHDTT